MRNDERLRTIYEVMAPYIVRSERNWRDYLAFASRFHKQSFDNILLVYAQDEDVTILASKKQWASVGRNLISRPKGIAVCVYSNARLTLDYLFDISQTVGREIHPTNWRLSDEMQKALGERLTFSHGFQAQPFPDLLYALARESVNDNYEHYLQGLRQETKNHLFEEIPAGGFEAQYIQLLTDSVSYFIGKKCHLPDDAIRTSDGMATVNHFNTVPLVAHLGMAVTSISKAVLLEMERNIRIINRERKVQYEQAEHQSELQRTGRDASPRPANLQQQRGGQAPGPVRADGAGISQGQPAGAIYDFENGWQSDGSHAPGAGRGHREDRVPDPADASAGPDAADRGHSGADTPSERPEADGGGNGTPDHRADPPLTEEQPHIEAPQGAEHEGEPPAQDGSFSAPTKVEHHFSDEEVRRHYEHILTSTDLYPPELHQAVRAVLADGVADYNWTEKGREICGLFTAYGDREFQGEVLYRTKLRGEDGISFYFDDGYTYFPWPSLANLLDALIETGVYPDVAAEEEPDPIGDYNIPDEIEEMGGVPQREIGQADYDYVLGAVAYEAGETAEEPVRPQAVFTEIKGIPKADEIDSFVPEPVAGGQQVIVAGDQDNLIPPAEESPSPHESRGNTTAHKNFRRFQKLFPEIVSGQYESLRLEAGDAYDPLVIHHKYGAHYCMEHYYMQNGDRMYDPYMDFLIDREAGTLRAFSYENSGIGVYQEADPADPTQEKRIAGFGQFFATWLNNIASQGYEPVRATMLVNDEEVDVELRPAPEAAPAAEAEEPEQLSLLASPPERSPEDLLIERAMLRGPLNTQKKERIYEFALTHPTGSAFASFLKEMYGYEGFPDEAAGLDYVYSGTDSIELHWTDEHGEKRETKLSWPQVAGIVQRLVDEGRYLEAPAVSQPVQQDEAQPFSGQYRLLDRLRTDCEYFLGAGQRAEKHLWAGSVDAQIVKMRELYAQLPEKPEWLSTEKIDEYARRMSALEPVAEPSAEPPEETRILDEALDSHNGQIDMLMQAVRGELTVGTIRYSIFEERPHINMIEVLEDYRRQGIATQMLRYLQGQYPNEEIEWGYLTEDGSALYRAVVDEQPNPEYQKVKTDLEDITRLYDGYVQRMDNGGILSPAEAADMDDLEDIQYRLEKELDELRPARAFIRMEDEPPAQSEEKAASEPPANPRPEPSVPRNFRFSADYDLYPGGAKTKYKNNILAIKTLKQIEAEQRTATSEEQITLARYVGWGGLANAFSDKAAGWESEYQELKALLTEEEYKAAMRSTITAYYTEPELIRYMYRALERFGFEGGPDRRILDPGMGTGNFYSVLPEQYQGTKLYGVELDSITGRIAQKLYPQAEIKVAGFETTDRRDFYDLAVGNVPFGNYRVSDKPYDKLGFSIHNYFFAKALDQVRPGGIVAFVTSRYTMDSKNPDARKYLAQRAELLGAIRLPNNAFRANAGTDVVSDIIFLQKRDHPIDIEPDWVHLGLTSEGITLNSYFVDHPEMVLGEITTESTQYGKEECTVIPIPDEDLGDQLHEAVQHIGGHYEAQELAPEEELSLQGETIPADPNVKNFSYAVVDGDVYFRENSIMRKADLSATATGRIKGMVELRAIVQELIDYQLNDYPEDAIAQKQRELNVSYDRFADQYGLINSRANAQAFSEDSSYYLLCSLENVDENGRLESKADMFTKRTIRPERAVTSVDTPAEALAISIGERGRVDLPYMSELLGTPGEYEKIQQELHGVIFKDPMTQGSEETGWVTADEYLSGNVREKLRVAELAAASDPAFAVNMEYLRKAQPKDLDASEIDVRLGATWVNRDYIQQFMEETFEPPFYLRRNIEVKFSPMTAEWQITGKSTPSRNDVHAYMTYGTSRANAYRILEDTLNLRDIRIYDTVEDADGKQKRVLNKKETTLAQQKQQAIKDAFQNWVWKDPYRRAELVEKYNELFNSTRPREYDGSHIRFGGMNPEIRLREHQQNAIAHVLYGGNTLLAHEVGAGKTFEMAASAMEAKRLGLCQKSMFVVPNHLTLQWANEFLRLYPSAKLLVASKKDFETARRKKFCARIATGDYDAVIIGHSQFEKIPVSAERQERILTAQIDEIENAIAEMKSQNGERFSIKQMEKTRKGLEARLEKLRATDRKDDVITFEQLGVDRLFVDEAHAFKNLFLYTKMRNVAGLSTSEAQKSSDMFMKCQYMDELTGGRGIIFATGTPVSNSMTELYTMMRYLQYGTLQQKGLTHFDSWASTFGETTTAIELAPEGTGYRARTRFAKFFNLPELMNMFKEVADIKTSDQLHLPVPEAKFETVVVQPSEHQQAMVAELSERAAAVHSGVVDPSVDNMLKITSDGRKLGLDQRLMNPLLPDDPNSKLNACVRNVLRIYEEGQSDKLTQLLFCDLSTPKNDGTFNVYEDIRAKLIQSGVPEEEIAFIHDADTEAKKKDLFAKVRTGQVRVLLGSTQKMGAGTNVQDRLVAVHHLDVGWRPADMTQRNGRIIRQGNRNKEVQVYQYVTEGTFDAYLYQTLENKQKFISQIMTSKSPVRSCDDVDEQALSYAEIKALCAGDPQIKEKMDLDVDVARLKVLKADHQSQQYRLEDKLMKYFPAEIEKTQGFIKGFQSDIRTVAAHPLPEEGFCGMEVNGTQFTEKAEAGEAILAVCKANQSLEPVPLGSYRGFKMELTFDSFQKEYQVLLKGEMTHRVPIGTSAAGNIQRLDNALAGIPARLEKAEQQLDNLRSQQEAAQAELGKPFPQEAELAEKSARLAELDALLNMDDRGNDDPDREKTTEKPSVLAELRDRAGRIPPMTHRDDEEVAL